MKLLNQKFSHLNEAGFGNHWLQTEKWLKKKQADYLAKVLFGGWSNL